MTNFVQSGLSVVRVRLDRFRVNATVVSGGCCRLMAF